MEHALEIKPSLARPRALAAREQKNRTARRMLALANALKGKSVNRHGKVIHLGGL